MSRIHEALKKAEQHRYPAGSPDAQPVSAEAVMPPLATPAGLDAPSSVALGGYAPLTFEALTARVQPARWTPNLKTMLFFGNNGHSVHSESFRTLRSRLYQFREKQPLRTLLVTSALPGEGKTFVDRKSVV